MPAHCHLRTYQQDGVTEKFDVILKGFDFVVGRRRENSTSQDRRTESFVAVAVCIEDIAGVVGLELGGRYSAALCLTLGHNVGFDRTRLRSALEGYAFAEREIFAAVAADSFPVESRPKECVNMDSAGICAAVPLVDRDPAGCSHSHRAQRGGRRGKPYFSESNCFHRGMSRSLN